jgi:hypothetical protein
MSITRSHHIQGAVCFALLLFAGCSDNDAGDDAISSAPSSNASSGAGAPDSDEETDDADDSRQEVVIAPIRLGGAGGGTSAEADADEDTDDRDTLLEAMEPLKVLTGGWRATPHQANPGDKLEEPNWAWDFQTEPGKPALVMSTNDSPYFNSIRLSYDVEAQEFTMTVNCIDDQIRELRGTFEKAPTEFQGDDRRMHITYKLTLSETDPADERDQWQVAFNQQDNNRYLVELYRWRSSHERFDRFDTINNQRDGTNFAQADDDYGERECIISGGLGTMQVSFAGKSYWVCCSGCQAAFNDDPEKWIARWEEKQREEMNE